MSASLDILPPELLLQVIPQVPFDPQTYNALRQTSRHINTLLKTHETSLVTATKRNQYDPQTSTALFPSLQIQTYTDLLTLQSRLQTLQDLHAQWLHLTSHGPELNWLRDRWEAVHKAGTLLLYRLQDCCCRGDGVYDPDAREDLLNLLPASSLACLVFKCYSAVKILRVHGPEPINARYAKDDVGLRCEIELAVEEMLLVHGPRFFVGLLKGRKWAVDVLNNEIAYMEYRQLHSAAPTLISILKRSFAQKTDGHVVAAATKMWEVLSSSSFDEVGPEKMVKIVTGEALVGGMKRMGY